MDTPSPSLVQTLPLCQLCGPRFSLWAFFLTASCKKTLIYLWNFSGTSFFASASDFATFSSSFQISYSSATLFTSIVFYLFCFYLFFPCLFLLLLSCLLFCFFLSLLLPPWFSLLWSPLLSTFLWTPCHLYLSCLPVNLRIVAS